MPDREPKEVERRIHYLSIQCSPPPGGCSLLGKCFPTKLYPKSQTLVLLRAGSSVLAIMTMWAWKTTILKKILSFSVYKAILDI